VYAQGLPFPRRQDVEEDAQVVGIPPRWAQIFTVDHAWLTREHPDPHMHNFTSLIAELDAVGAQDNDLAFIDFLSVWQAPRTERQEREFAAFLSGLFRMWSFCGFRAIVLPHLPPDMSRGYFSRGWCVHGFSTMCYALRIVNARDPLVRSYMTPEWIGNFSREWAALKQDNDQRNIHLFTNPADEALTWEQRARFASQMTKSKEDAVGFQVCCHIARFRWVRVAFVYALAQRGGPMPRHQDLPVGVYVDGVVPPGVQPWVVSYSWSAHLHPDPGGGKIRELAEVLRRLSASESDVVFLDFMGLPTGGGRVPKMYHEANPGAKCTVSEVSGTVELPDRTLRQRRQFDTALAETTRLYAFSGGTRPDGVYVMGCKVLVLPDLQRAETFPDHGGIREEENTFCDPPRWETLTDWGFCKSVPYENGGWTCAEFAVARRNGTIANQDDEVAQRIEKARAWPTTVHEYARMMDEGATNPVTFTKKGDREAVRFNFYKFTYAFSEEVG